MEAYQNKTCFLLKENINGKYNSQYTFSPKGICIAEQLTCLSASTEYDRKEVSVLETDVNKMHVEVTSVVNGCTTILFVNSKRETELHIIPNELFPIWS